MVATYCTCSISCSDCGDVRIILVLSFSDRLCLKIQLLQALLPSSEYSKRAIVFHCCRLCVEPNCVIAWWTTTPYTLRQVNHLNNLYSNHLQTPIFVALAGYEYVLTWREEQTLVWHRKWTMSTWLFLANHYLLLLTTTMSAMPYTRQVSNPLGLSTEFLDRIIQV